MKEYYEAFLEYFLGLNLSGQILTGILLIIGLVAIGYVIYGSVWITYQSIKFSIVLIVIIVYICIAMITISISLLANEANIGNIWSKTSFDIQNIISYAYNFDKSQTGPVISIEKKTSNPSPPVIIIKKLVNSDISAPIIQEVRSEGNYGVNTIPNFEDVNEIKKEEIKPLENTIKSKSRQGFCPNCGSKFSSKMLDVLKDMSFTFCEFCGEKFQERVEYLDNTT